MEDILGSAIIISTASLLVNSPCLEGPEQDDLPLVVRALGEEPLVVRTPEGFRRWNEVSNCTLDLTNI